METFVSPRVTTHVAERLGRNELKDVINNGTPLEDDLVRAITARTTERPGSVYILAPSGDGILVLARGVAITFLRLCQTQQNILRGSRRDDSTPAMITAPDDAAGIKELRSDVKELIFDIIGARTVHYDPPIGELPPAERRGLLRRIIDALVNSRYHFITSDDRGLTSTIHWESI